MNDNMLCFSYAGKDIGCSIVYFLSIMWVKHISYTLLYFTSDFRVVTHKHLGDYCQVVKSLFWAD